MQKKETNINRYNYLIGEMNAVYHEIALKFGLSDSTMQVLYIIYDKGGGCLLQDLCHGSGMSKQTVNSALRKLETEGIIYLQAHDKKQKRVCLTERGAEVSSRTVGQLHQMEDAVFSTWTKEEQNGYLRMTQRFLEGIREGARQLKEKYQE